MLNIILMWMDTPTLSAQHSDSGKILFGDISTGNIWQFGQFDRTSRQMTQDLTLYRVPADLAELIQILVHTLKP